MKKIIAGVAIVVPLIFCSAVFYMSRQDATLDLQPMAAEPANPSSAPAQAERHYPLPEDKDRQAAATPLPPLNESDQFVQEALAGPLVHQSLKGLFRLEDMVRNIVVTIDNIPRRKMAVRQYPVTPAGGAFLTTQAGESLAIAAENAKRYTPYVRMAESVNTKAIVATYVQLYPLFQRAYQELGYPHAQFNDRLIAVIDHLLKAPEIDGTVALVQPHVVYRFADPELEADSAGHKIMVRMGRENAAKIKAKLREIRRELTRDIPRE